MIGRWEVQGVSDAPAVAVLGGISAGRHVAAHAADSSPGWWEGIVGHACAIDPARHRTIGIDWIGTSLGDDDAPLAVSTHDQAHALAQALDDAGIDRLHALIGSSYGGMVGLAFAALFPDRVERLVLFGAAHRPHPMATAVRTVQRGIVTFAASAGRSAEGLALARALAMTTYRTAEELGQRFDSTDAVSGWLAHHGDVYARTWTAPRFLTLSGSIDTHSIDPATITTPTTLTSFSGDAIAPPSQLRELAALLAGDVTLHEIETPYGHDAFLKETGVVSNIITCALQNGATQ